MPKYAAHILAEALELPPVERAELVENILSSFEFQARNTINAIWSSRHSSSMGAISWIIAIVMRSASMFTQLENRKCFIAMESIRVRQKSNKEESFCPSCLNL